jgi:hypothetical protein
MPNAPIITKPRFGLKKSSTMTLFDGTSGYASGFSDAQNEEDSA